MKPSKVQMMPRPCDGGARSRDRSNWRSSGPSGTIFTTSPSRSNSHACVDAAGEAMADAGMVEQVARVLRPAARGEIGRRGGGGETLLARPDRHGDHVALQPLVVADAGVEAGGEHVDEGVLGRDLQHDAGMLAAGSALTSGGSTMRATTVGTLRRSVPTGLSRKLLTASSAAPTSPSAGVSRSSRRWPASVSVTLRVVRLSRRTPSRASSRRSASLSDEAETPRSARRAAEAAGARDCGEGVEIGEVRCRSLYEIPHSLFGIGRIIARNASGAYSGITNSLPG